MGCRVRVFCVQAVWESTPEGGITANVLARFLREAWLDRLDPSEQKARKLLILDSGGGGLVHLNVPCFVWSMSLFDLLYRFS